MNTVAHAKHGARRMSRLPPPLIERMNYDEYWRARQPRPFPPRVYFITPLLAAGSSVLDLGCGDGELYEYARQRRPDLRWQGIDISTVALMRAAGKGMSCRQADITKLDFLQSDEQHDYIVISEVLEHITNPEEVLQYARGHCVQKLIITVPNIAYFKHRLRLLSGRFPLQWSWHPSEHLRFWSLSDFPDWLRHINLDRWSLVSTNGFPYENRPYPAWHRWWPNLLAEGAIFVIDPGRAT